jgi:hypothetical protein
MTAGMNRRPLRDADEPALAKAGAGPKPGAASLDIVSVLNIWLLAYITLSSSKSFRVASAVDA